jgi:eukaryotic-like serine/threonine-protein kinase
LSATGNERIGPYRLIRRLGIGGMGEVFLAYDERLERTVAIKQLRREGTTGATPHASARSAADPTRRERLHREARSAARLSHPNIVQVYDILEGDDGGDSVVMEYVAGRSIAEILRDQGPLSLTAAAGLARQIAAGLAAAHAAGLVHRDLKAENVLVDPEGRARILDFGLAKPLDCADATLTEHGAVLGTYRSMSPEQARGEPADERSDLFSLGVLIYEMLAGASPFEGRTPLETLRKVDAAEPPPVSTLRPDTPPQLADLLRSLLARDPGRRPPDAHRVARALLRLESSLPGPEATGDGLDGPASGLASQLGYAPTVTALPRPFPAPRPDSEPTTLSGTIVRPQARRLAAALLVLLAVATAGFLLVNRLALFAREPLRVAVLRPTAASGSGLDLAASGVLIAELRGLLALQGVTAIDPAQIGEVRGSPLDAARAVSADEVLAAAVEGDGRNGFVSLRRIDPRRGAILWAERFPVPLGVENALILAHAVTAALRRGYPEHEPRPGSHALDVRAADYAEMIRIKRRLDAGRSAWEPELDRLDSLLQSSPRFLDAHLQAAGLAINLYNDTRQRRYLDRAQAFVAGAESLDPGSPPLLSVEIALAIATGRWQEAESVLRRLEGLVPGDPIVLVQRSRLAAARGRLDDAAAFLRQAVERRPTWRDLLALADLESRRGRTAAARSALEQALALVSGNTWVLAKLGELELLYGDLHRARDLYTRLAAAGPQRSDLTNLGLVRFLLGDYEGAVASYRQALALSPGHLLVTLDLADAEAALGRSREALAHYADVLHSLEAKAASGPLQPVEMTVKAQCLAHLGRRDEAVALALDSVQAHAEPEVTYQASLVLALAGERASALALARKAISLGVRARWFRIPGFQALTSDPSFRRLVSEEKDRAAL